MFQIFCIVAFIAVLSIGCGGKGGPGIDDGTDTGDVDEPSIPSPTYNFTGTVYKRSGSPVDGATVTALNGTKYFKDVTQSNGQFALNLDDGVYTVIGSQAGYIDTVRRLDRSSGGTKEMSMLLSEAGIEKRTTNVRASAGGTIALDSSDAEMQIQSGSTINVGTDRNLSNQDITVELIDLSKPLPVPLPSPETLDETVVNGKQTPSILLQIRPTLLELNPSAKLTMPNPDELVNVRILHFDPFTRKWSEVGKTAGQPEKTATVDAAKGGVYGIFFETEAEQNRVSVSGTAEKGAMVFVGDEVVKASSVDGYFYFDKQIPVSGNKLEIVSISEDPENEGKFVPEIKTATVLPGQNEIELNMVKDAAPTYNLTGAVFGENGKSMPGVNIQAIRDENAVSETVAGSEGEFSFALEDTTHTLLAMGGDLRIDAFQLVNVSQDAIDAINMILMETNVVSQNILPTTNHLMLKPTNQENLSLEVLAQPGNFTVDDNSGLSSVDVSLVPVNINKPLPVPLPSPDNLENDLDMPGRRAPSLLVEIKPALLKLAEPWNLTIPAPAELANARILRFDPYKHLWVEAGTTDDTPEDGSTISIYNGGFYGIFYEDSQQKFGSVRGTAKAGSLIFIGDKAITVPANGQFVADKVPAGELNIVWMDPEEGASRTESVSLLAGKTTNIDFAEQLFVGDIALQAENVSAIAGTKIQITAEIRDVNQELVSDGTSVVFFTETGDIYESRADETASSQLKKTTQAGKAIVYVGLENADTVVLEVSSGDVERTIELTFTPVPGSISLSLSQHTIKTDNSDSATISATVLDTLRTPYEGVTVHFSIHQTYQITNQSLAVLENAVLPDGGSVPDDVLSSLESLIDQQPKDKQFFIEAIKAAISLEDAQEYGDYILQASKLQGGQLSKSSEVTDENGIAEVQISSGTSVRRNQIIEIIAEINGLDPTSIPVQIVGTNINLEADRTTLGEATLTISIKDASMNPIYNAWARITSVDPQSGERNQKILFKVDNEGPATELTDTTDVNGEIEVKLKANAVEGTGLTLVQVESMGTKRTKEFTTSPELAFGIKSPEPEPSGYIEGWTDAEIPFQVEAAEGHTVRFSTTFGFWKKEVGETDNETQQVLTEVEVIDGLAVAYLKSNQAGISTVQVVDEVNVGATEIAQVAFAAPSDKAKKISLQASATVVAPSIGDLVNTVTLSAVVKTDTDQVVSDAWVAFAMNNTTGGGETISPVVVQTDSFGVARSTFSSGTLSSGAQGITIVARIVNTEISDSTAIVIGGTAGSLNINPGSKIQSVNTDTAYQLPMSIIVSDANGNAVSGATVSLSTWPELYSTGGWTNCPEGQQGCCIYTTGNYENEDVNRNLICDGCSSEPPCSTAGQDNEDKDGNCKLTPPGSAVGTLPSSIVTNENGIGEFNLTYPKSSAGWIYAEIKASTLVSGSETQSVYKFWLPWAGEDAASCSLPASPFNTEDPIAQDPAQISLEASPNEIEANGESVSIIEADVIDVLMNPVSDNTVVTFSNRGGILSCPEDSGDQCVQKDNGEIEAKTTEGKTSVVLTSSTSLITASVTAVVGDLSNQVFVEFIPGSPDMAELKASPVILAADGRQTSSITAAVFDEIKDGGGEGVDIANPVSDGHLILFSLSPEKGSLSPTSDKTNEDGVAETVYTAPTESGPVSITAKDANGVVLGQVDIQIVDVIVGGIVVSTGAVSTGIIADGQSSALISATITDSNGAPIKDGVSVTFETTAGGFKKDDAMASKIEVLTVNGKATTMLTSATNVGVANVTAISGGVSAATTVEFVPGAPARVLAKATPAKLTLGGDVAESSITATVLDANDNLVPNVTLTIRAENGLLDSGNVDTVDGTAEVNYTPPSFVPQSGKDLITLETTNGVAASVEIQLVGPQIANIALDVDPSSLPADGKSQATIRATLTMVGGDPAPDGTPVFFGVSGDSCVPDVAPPPSPNPGFFGEESAVFTESLTVGGEAIATLTSGDVACTATIRVGTDKSDDPEEIKGIAQEIDIDYTPGSVSLLIVPNVVLGTGEEICDGTAQNCAEVIVTLEDVNGGPPEAGQEVEFRLESSASMSQTGDIQVQNDWLQSGIIKSDANGVVKANYLAPSEGGEVTITAIWKNQNQTVEVKGTETITVYPPPVAINVIPPEQTEISVRGTGGQETVQLFFEVKDNAGNLVEDGYRIDFSILTGPGGGEIVTPIFDITDNGKVGTVLRSGFESGPVSIKAISFYDSNISTVVSQIVIKAGPPVGEEFGIVSQFKNISGLVISGLENGLTVNVGDYYGNAVPDKTAISFKTYNTGGLIEGEDQNATTTGGFAYSKLYTTPSPWPIQGFVSVTAEAVGGRTTHVTCIDLVPVDFGARDRYVIYAGTNGGGIYKSLDSGKTWENRSRSSEHPGQNWIEPYINDISIDRDDPKKIYAATGYLGAGNIYRSLDGGLNWNSSESEEWNGLKSYPDNRGDPENEINQIESAVSTVLCDYDDEPVPYRNFPFVWAGTEANGVFYSRKGKFFTQADGLGDGTNVQDIVRVVGTHGDEAILYAATGSGVYKSRDGGKTWLYDTNDPNDGVPSPFFGDHVNVLALHSNSDGGVSDVLYAGTEDAGVWVSTDSGKSWRNYTEGLGEGVKATPPLADKRNKGSGKINDVRVTKTTGSENWTVEYEEYAECEPCPVGDCSQCDSGQCEQDQCETTKWGFTVTGSDSGVIVNPNDPKQPAYVKPGEKLEEPVSTDLSFAIQEGNIPFEQGDKFTFTTIRDPGLNIKSLLLDEVNNRLYALTYFEPEGSHSIGNIYYYNLKTDGSGLMKEGALWVEANAGLPEFDPPDDRTLFAQHALALSKGPFGETKSLFVGGEGINFYKATSGLNQNLLPNWTESKSGIDNTIMARTPVLFSGYCDMYVDLIAINNQPVVGGYTINSGDLLTFQIYIQDENGNPPIGGSATSNASTFIVNEENFTSITSIFERTYPDTHTYAGTYRDPSNETTNRPFIISYVAIEGEVKLISFNFTPNCGFDAPGCSGSPHRDVFTLPW